MDYLKNQRAVASLNNEFGNSYDPTTTLDPDVAARINQLAPVDRPAAVDKAFDEAGTYAKLKRALQSGIWGDIYKKD